MNTASVSPEREIAGSPPSEAAGETRFGKFVRAAAIYFLTLVYAFSWTMWNSAMDADQSFPGSGLSLKTVSASAWIIGVLFCGPSLLLQVLYTRFSAHVRYFRILIGSTLALILIVFLSVVKMPGGVSDIADSINFSAHLFLTNAFLLTAIYLFRVENPDISIDRRPRISKFVLLSTIAGLVAVSAIYAAYVFGYESGELFYHDRWSHNSAYWKTSADLDERYLKRTAGPCSCATEKMHELSVEFPDQRYSELITNLGDATFMFPENLDRDQDRESYRIRGWQEVEVNRQTCMVRWQMPLEGRDRSGDFVGRCSGGSIIGRVYVPIRMGRDVGPPEVGNWIMK